MSDFKADRISFADSSTALVLYYKLRLDILHFDSVFQMSLQPLPLVNLTFTIKKGPQWQP